MGKKATIELIQLSVMVGLVASVLYSYLGLYSLILTVPVSAGAGLWLAKSQLRRGI